MRTYTTLVALGLLVASCGTTAPVTQTPFATKQVVSGDGLGVFNANCPTTTSTVATVPLSSVYSPLNYVGLTSPWISTMPFYSSTLAYGALGYPYGLYGGYGLGYGGFGYGSYGYGGFGGGFHHRGGVAEQNDVAYRPVGSKIWKSK